MSEDGKINWTAVGAIAGVAAVVVTAAGVVVGWMVWRQTEDKNRADKEQEPAQLVEPGPQQPVRPDDVRPAAEHMPWGPGLPTPLPFQNRGKREAAVKQVILSNWTWVPRPKRRNIAGAGKAIQATFEPRHYVPATGHYMLVLQEPASVPGNGEWTTLNVTLVDPAKVDKTMICKVTIIYDGLDQMHFEDVEIDPVERPPDTKKD